jgi:PAS domain S-box-containing protein
MGRTRIRADSELVATAAALTTPSAEERVRRTERRLIEAALAVNEAPTLEAALTELTETAAALAEADRISLLEWDARGKVGRLIAGSGPAAPPPRLQATDPIAELIRADKPFVLGGPLRIGLDSVATEVVDSWGTLLVVPVVAEGQPPLTISAAWKEARSDDEVEIATTKLRLLGRLTRIAYRAEAERARELESAQLRAVLESVPDGLVIRTADTAIINSAARELLGVEGEPAEKLHMRTLEGSPVPLDETPLQIAKRTGEKQDYVLRVPRGDGVERIHEGTIAPVTDEHGRVLATVTIFRDVTEAHEQRWVTEQFLQRLFEELPLAVGLGDPRTGEIFSANQAFLDLIGYDANEVIGAEEPYPWWAETTPSAQLAEEKPRATYERLFRRKTGELVPVEVTRSLIRDANGDASAFVALITDLSERRAFEQQLIQSGKLASIGELAAGVAHEINNPLFAILGFVEFLLADAERGSKAHERLTVIQDTALEIREIVRALLDFARERTDERAPISLTDVAAQTVSLMRRMSAKKDVEIVERFDVGDVIVEASANQLKQIFVNLISNAQQAMPGGGKITVEVGRDGEIAWAEVRDTGPGIPEEEAERIFEPFYTTRRDRGGTGLGLSVSFGIAQAHGGGLVVESKPGEGAAFRLRLPAFDGDRA